MTCKGCNGSKNTSLGGIVITCRVCKGSGSVKVNVVQDEAASVIDKRSKEYRELKKKEG